ncbi:MAG: hypothetical protein WC654_06715 [Patescibacteria group bacterium]
MVYVIKKLLDIGSPNPAVRKAPRKILGPRDCAKEPLTFSARPGVIDEGSVEYLHQVVVEESMDHPITNNRHRQITPLVIRNRDTPVRTMLVRLIHEGLMQVSELVFKAIAKLVNLPRSVFATPKAVPDSP